MDTGKPSSDFAVHSSVNDQLPATLSDQARSRVTGGSELEPHALQSRSAAPIQNAGDPVTLSLSVPGGGSGIFSSSLISNNGDRVKQFLRYQLYIGVVSTTFRIPEAFPSTFFPFYEYSPLYDSAGVALDRGTDLRNVQVRNTGGSTQLMYITAGVDYECNRTDGVVWTTSFTAGL